METSAYAYAGSTELLDSDRMDISDKDSVDSGGSSLVSKDESASPSQKKKLSFKGRHPGPKGLKHFSCSTQLSLF